MANLRNASLRTDQVRIFKRCDSFSCYLPPFCQFKHAPQNQELERLISEISQLDHVKVAFLIVSSILMVFVQLS